MRTGNLVRLMACIFITSMIGSASVAYAASGSDVSADVHHDTIVITLPVFVVSLVFAVGCTWTIAKYDNSRVSKLDALESRVDALIEHLEDGRAKPLPPRCKNNGD